MRPDQSSDAAHHLVHRRAYWCALLLVGVPILTASCGDRSTQADAGSTVLPTSIPARQTIEDLDVNVLQVGLTDLSFAEGPGAGYVWGALLDNETDKVAADVEVAASFLDAQGEVVRTDIHRIDEIPPGEFSWGSIPVNVFQEGARLELSDVVVSISVGHFELDHGERDILVSSDRRAWFGYESWRSEPAVVVGADDSGELFAVHLYLDSQGKVLAGGFARVWPQPKIGYETEVDMSLSYPDLAGLAEIRVFLTRLSHWPNEFESHYPDGYQGASITAPSTVPPTVDY